MSGLETTIPGMKGKSTTIPFSIKLIAGLKNVGSASNRLEKRVSWYFSHEYVVTNFHKELSAKSLFQIYHKRGTMDKFIKEATFQADTLRLRLFKVAGNLVHIGRSLLLRMSSSHVYQDFFYQLLDKIQQLSWQG